MSHHHDVPPERAAGPADRRQDGNLPVETTAPDPRLEDYLDHVCAPLVGLVPYARRQELRSELRGHLEALAAGHEEVGADRDQAIVSALRQFGPSGSLSRQWAHEQTRAASSARLESAWPAMCVGLASFGVTTLLSLALLAAVTPREGPTISSTPELVMIGIVGIFLSALAGLTTGLLAPARHALGAFYATALLALPSAALALHAWLHPVFSLGQTLALEMGLVQPLFWIPIGCAAAAMGGWLRDYLAWKPPHWVLQ